MTAAERAERWRVPTHLDTPDGVGPLTARQLALLAGAGLYVGPALAWVLGPLGPGLGLSVPLVSDNLSAGQAGVMLGTLGIATPFACSGDPPLEHGLTAAAQHYLRPRLLGGAQAARLSGIRTVDGPLVRAHDGPPLRAVWELPSINTRLADAALLGVLRERYAEFLNAISFPFQIVVRATPVSTEPLLRALGERADAKAAHLAAWLRALLSGRGLVERRRFLAIAADDEAQLEDRVEAIEQGLAGLDLAGRRLGIGDDGQATDELRQLLHAGWTPRPHKAGRPIGASVVHLEADALAGDGAWQSVIAVSRWPHAIDDDWLRRLVAGPLPLDVVWHVRPVANDAAARTLNAQLRKWETGSPSIARRVAIEDAHNLLEALERGQERVWDVDLLVLGRARSHDEARGLVRKAERLLAEQSAEAKALRWEQAAAVAACQPMADSRLRRRKRRVDTSSLARTYPFGAAELVLQGGVPIGETKEGARPVVWTPYRRPLLPNPHLAVFGPPGCGKGVLVKVTYSRLYLAGLVQQIDVIDQDGEHATGEYGRFAEYCGGQVHYLNHASDIDDKLRWGRQHDVLVWNLAGVPIDERPEALVRIKQHRWKASEGGRLRSALVLDELWTFLREQASAAAVEEVVRLGRHVKVSGVFMTQRGSDCLQSTQGQVILSSASSQWFGMLGPSELSAAAGPLELSTAVQATIRRFRQGDGLLIAGPYQVAMRVIPTPEELAMAQTDYESEVDFAEASDTGQEQAATALDWAAAD